LSIDAGEYEEDETDWFEESEQQVEEGDLNRTMETMGVDVVEEVRSPAKQQKPSASRPITDSFDDDEFEISDQEVPVPKDASPVHAHALSTAEQIAKFMKGRSSDDAHAVANEVTNVLMQRLLASALTSPAAKNALKAQQKEEPVVEPVTVRVPEPQPVASDGKDDSGSDAGSEGVAGVAEESLEEDITEEYEEDDLEVDVSNTSAEKPHSPDAKRASSPKQIVVEEEEEVAVVSEDEEEVESVTEEEYSDEDFDAVDEDSRDEITVAAVAPLPVSSSSSLSALGALPSLGGPKKQAEPVKRDTTLDDLLGEDEESQEAAEARPPRFGLPARPRETDAFAVATPVFKEDSVTAMWSRRKKVRQVTCDFHAL
jgi:hypothetical protein